MTIEAQTMDVDIACVGFGPAMAGFLTTLSRGMVDENGLPLIESSSIPGMPPQVLCYERADDIGFGVSGVVTRARSIRETFPGLDLSEIPMACPVTKEEVLYLLDPVGASRRSTGLRFVDGCIKALKAVLPVRDHALDLPYIPPFLCKHDGIALSIGQFNQWAGSNLMASGLVQIWPGMPVSAPLLDGEKVVGIKLADQGVNKDGSPTDCFMPGMQIRANLTVVGDGPVGAVGQVLDRMPGMPEDHHLREWAVGMKAVVELPESCTLEPGTVIHTFGYPEPEIFGFLYVYPDRIASLGIFVPSWLDSPVRTSYRYLQHWMQHPALWKHLQGGALRSWGAKSIQESGKRGEPLLAGDGFARIGEGSGSTNMLTGSGVDEAWATGTQLAEGVLELMKEGKPFTQENLEDAYVARRRKSWVEKECTIAKKARDGFQSGFLKGLIGMGLTGMTGGLLNLGGEIRRPQDRIPTLEEWCAGRIPPERIETIRKECVAKGKQMSDAVLDELGWPPVPHDGTLLVSQQDALLMGGKVQAAPGFADHVVFVDHALCESCDTQICVEICSGQAIARNEGGGVPLFDREKCVHCGACLWNCSKSRPGDPERTNIDFRAGSGGLHSAEN